MTTGRRAWAIVATSLAALFVSASPALAGPTCRRWEFQNQTFDLRQSTGHVLRITFGQPISGNGRVEFPQNGQVRLVREGGIGDFVGAPRFTPADGRLAFIVNWRPPADRPKDFSQGIYYGEPHSIRPAGDGGLIADLRGWTEGNTRAEATLLDWQFNRLDSLPTNETREIHARANWTAPGRIVCRPADVLPDGVTAKDQRAAIEDAEARRPPPKVLRSGKKPAPEGPTVVPPSLMRGGWNTRTSTDGYFTLILIPAHDGMGPLAAQPIPVTGQFLNQQGAHDYDGGLQGYILPGTRTLQYTYTQRNGAAGTGVFTLSNDGNALTGSGKASDGTSFTWNGTRAK